MADIPRLAERFESVQGGLTYAFSRYDYEYQSNQGLRASSVPIIGASYDHDALGFARSPKEDGHETIRGVVLPNSWAEYDTARDTARAVCTRIGMGKLYTIDSLGVRRWAYARLVEIPEIDYQTRRGRVLPLIFKFRRSSNWRALSPTQGEVDLDNSLVEFTINNPGNEVVTNAVFRIHSNGATGLTGPWTLRRLGSLYSAEFSITSSQNMTSADDEIRMLAEQFRVQYSADDGDTYTDIYDGVTLAPGQAWLMELDPGDNLFEFESTGTPDSTLEYTFSAAFI